VTDFEDGEYNPANATYDIFKKDSTGSPIWIEAVQGLDQVKKRLISLASARPDEYLVFNPATNTFVDLNAKKQSA
jgi:hypothetical protein